MHTYMYINLKPRYSMHNISSINIITERSLTMAGLSKYWFFGILPSLVLGQNGNATVAEQPFRSFNSTP